MLLSTPQCTGQPPRPNVNTAAVGNPDLVPSHNVSDKLRPTEVK